MKNDKKSHQAIRNPVSGMNEGCRSLPVFRKTFLIREGQHVELGVQEWMAGKIYVNAGHHSEVPVGTVLTSNQAQGRKGEPLFACYQSLFTAIRGQGTHVVEGYMREARKLELVLGSVPEMLRAIWNAERSSPVGQDAYRQLVMEAQAVVSRSREEGKVEAAKLLLEAANLHDVLGRWNPLSRPLKIAAARNRVRTRAAQTRLIRHRLNWRLITTLLTERDRIKWLVQDVINECMEAKHICAMPTRRDVGVKEKMNAAMACANRLEFIVLKRLNSVVVAPWGQHAFLRWHSDLTEVHHSLREARYGKAQERLDTLWRAARLLDEVQPALESLLTRASLLSSRNNRVFPHKHGEADHMAFLAELGQMRDNLEGRPGLDRGFTNPVLKDLRSHLDAAWKAANHKGAPDLPGAKEALQQACDCL